MTPAQPNLDDLLQHAGWVRRLALSLCADAARAEDAVQETWLSALRSPPRRPGNLRGWLGTALRSVLRQGARAEGRRQRREVEHGVGARGFAEAAADAACRAELHRGLVQLVLALPEPQRTVVLLHYFDNLDTAAVAARTHLSSDAVRAHLRRAREALRARLERQGGDAARGLALLLAAVPHRGLTLVMSLTSKLALGAAAVAAAAFAWSWWPTPAAPAVAPRDGSPTVVSDAAPARDPAPTTAHDPQRTALAPTASAPGRTLTVRLTGLLPQAPWTARLRLDIEGQLDTDRLEHEDRIAVAAGVASAPVPAWIATAANVRLRLDARDPFYLPLEVRRESDAARSSEITIPVQPVGVLSGQVRDARGAGIGAVRVVTFAMEDGRARDVATGDTTTRADGTFTLQTRIEGALLLVALPMQPAAISGARLTLEDGGVADSGVARDDLLPTAVLTEVRHGEERDVSTLVAGDPAWVTGSVHFADGAPVAGARVQVMDSVFETPGQSATLTRVSVGSETLLITTDGLVLRFVARVTASDDGAFRVAASPGRSAWIAVLEAPTVDFMQAPHSVTSRAPATVRIELTGRVLTISPMHRGTPIGKHMLTIRTTQVNQTRTTERPCTVLADPGGPLTGSIRAEGFETAQLHIDVANAPDVVAIEMVPIERVRLRIDLHAATRVRQAVLHFERLDGNAPSLRRGVFRDDGDPWFVVDVAPGRYRLRIEAPAKAERRDLFVLPATHEIEVGRDPAPLRLPVGHGGNIRLEVVDARGLPLLGTAELTRDGTRVPVLWKPVDSAEQSPQVHDRLLHDGAHALQQPIPAGQYVLTVTVAGRGTRRADVDVQELAVSETRVQY